MSLRRRYITVEVDTHVDVSLSDIARDLTDADVLELVKSRGMPTNDLTLGDGDDSRLRGIVDAAERELRQMPSIPRPLADLMWYVHGRAIA